MNRLINALLLLLMLLAGGCRHKDLCFDHDHNIEVEVEFNWRKHPTAQPASMEIYLYDRSDGKVIRFNFSGRDGGKISLPYGVYDCVCINSDITDWASFRNTDAIGTFETVTQNAHQLMSYGLDARSVPRAEGSEQERLAMTPKMVWSDRQDGFELKTTDTYKKLTMYPGEVVSHYTVDIFDIKNVKYVEGKSIDGVLSGLAEGFRHGQQKQTEVPVTMPFEMKLSDDKSSLHSEFLTFGKCDDDAIPNKMTVYVKMTDGSKKACVFDVSDQVAKAQDPRHVHIIIRGFELPKPIVDGGGVLPDVNDWEVEQYVVKMN